MPRKIKKQINWKTQQKPIEVYTVLSNQDDKLNFISGSFHEISDDDFSDIMSKDIIFRNFQSY